MLIEINRNWAAAIDVLHLWCKTSQPSRDAQLLQYASSISFYIHRDLRSQIIDLQPFGSVNFCVNEVNKDKARQARDASIASTGCGATPLVGATLEPEPRLTQLTFQDNAKQAIL